MPSLSKITVLAMLALSHIATAYPQSSESTKHSIQVDQASTLTRRANADSPFKRLQVRSPSPLPAPLTHLQKAAHYEAQAASSAGNNARMYHYNKALQHESLHAHAEATGDHAGEAHHLDRFNHHFDRYLSVSGVRQG